MKTFLFFSFVFCSFICSAQDNPEKIINEFFRIYKEKSSGEALDYLFKTNRWMDDSQDQIENVKFKLNNQVVKAMGDYYGYRPITKKSISEDYVLYTYMLKYDRQPVRFTFLFYNPNGKWRLQNFSFNDGLSEEVEEAAKAYRLKENLEY